MDQMVDFDEKLYSKLRLGDKHAFSVVFDQYNRLLYALAYRYLKSDSEAEDAVQHVFMQLWAQRDTFEFKSGIKGLLFTILKNYVLNELRHRQMVFEKHYEMAQQPEGAEQGFLEELESKELRGYLRKAIHDLPLQKKKICLLKIERKLSNQEIADLMGITVPTVKSHYTQAIKMLRNAIEPLLVLYHVMVSLF